MNQAEALTLLTMGKNVFLTGPPGSGKTYVLNEYIAWLRKRGVEPAITASTGIAATHIGGQTIHSWAGIGIKDTLTNYDLDLISQTERLVKRFRKTNVLIIDEISMIRGETLRMVNAAIKAGLQSHEPFGGMQVVLSGDFFQLPPVEKKGDAQFCFQSNTWKELGLHTCYLEGQHRQNDTALRSVLQAIRTGTVSKQHIALLNRQVTTKAPKGMPCLYTHNIDVDAFNNKKLSLLRSPAHIFRMETRGSKKHVESLKRGVLTPEMLTLKKGAEVLFVKNHPQGMYMNGTIGKITGFRDGLPMVKTRGNGTILAEQETWTMEEHGKVLAEVTQVPLRLAWAITIHKSQGMTLDGAHIELSKSFVHGQGYVALSRVRSLDTLSLAGFNDVALSRNSAVARADTIFQSSSEKLVSRLKKTSPSRLTEIRNHFLSLIGGKTIS